MQDLLAFNYHFINSQNAKNQINKISKTLKLWADNYFCMHHLPLQCSVIAHAQYHVGCVCIMEYFQLAQCT